tara:strand:+ start:239 stop:1426 length:1188 start_codon:yes stop_codon:yes gene_type:complete
MPTKPKGRPRRYARYEVLLEGPRKADEKRPRYVDGIGVYRGARSDTAWIKIRLPRGGTYKGKYHAANSSLEVKLGQLSSWSWDELEAEQTEWQRKADHGEALDGSDDVLFKDWAEGWLKRVQNQLKGLSVAKAHVKKHLVPTFGNKPLSAITNRDVRSWVDERLTVAKPSTVHRERGTLSSMLSDAVRSGHIETNPCLGTGPIRGITGRQRFLDGRELAKLLKAAKDTDEAFPDFIMWCVHSGMRKGEVMALKWRHIRDLKNGRVVVLIETSKTDQPRMVHCTPTMVEILKRQRKRVAKDIPDVFSIADITLRRRWNKVRKLAGLEDVTMHDLRRTSSTHAIAAGVDLRTVAGRLGHTDLKMLEKHYAALVNSAAVGAADKIEEIFSKMTEPMDG